MTDNFIRFHLIFLVETTQSYNVSGLDGTVVNNRFESVELPTGSSYSATVSNSYGCANVEVAGMKDCGPPCTSSAELIGDQILCSGSVSNLTVNFEGEAPFHFIYTDGLSQYEVDNINAPNYVITTGVTGLFSLISMRDNVCSGAVSGSIDLVEVQTPTVTVENDTVCSGMDITLLALVDVSGGSFNWSNGETTSAITLNSGAYCDLFR